MKNRSGNPLVIFTVPGDPRLAKIILTITQGFKLEWFGRPAESAEPWNDAGRLDLG
jgi:hypothetical protein